MFDYLYAVFLFTMGAASAAESTKGGWPSILFFIAAMIMFATGLLIVATPK